MHNFSQNLLTQVEVPPKVYVLGCQLFDARYLPQLLFTLFSETKSLPNLEIC